FCSIFAYFPPFWRKTGELTLRQQVFFTHQQVAERSQQVQSVTVFGQAAIFNPVVQMTAFKRPIYCALFPAICQG
ncbi:MULTISPECIES: hypothetical protein, partial [unclassified Marinobacter]|uniref:hypothetical protein n=1 Tax=unclassified Marinobacter TaxID=83889 RepID=UPI001A7E33E4